MSHLRPAFKKDGSVTAGNASGINDGASMMLVMTEEKAKELNIKPIAILDGFGTSGVDPSIMGIGPVDAVKKHYNVQTNLLKISMFSNLMKHLHHRL